MIDQIGWFIPTILIGIIAFLTTNIDNLLLLILLFSQPDFGKKDIVVGQYIGFIVILVASCLGFFGKFLLPLAWIGLLGLVPIIVGIKGVIGLLRRQKLEKEVVVDTGKRMWSDQPPSFARVALGTLLSPQTYRVSVMTVGNGSDNISTYTPLFASGNFLHMAVLITLFLLLVGVWCYLGSVVARLPTVASAIKHYGRILLPFAFIMLGLLIMIKSGTFLLLTQL